MSVQPLPEPADVRPMAYVGSEQARETSGLTVRLIVGYVRRARGDEGVAELLRRAGETRPLAVLENERVWSSYAAKISLLRAAGEVTGEADVGRRIGAFALDSSVGPSLRLMLAMFGSPSVLLRHIANAGVKFTTVADLRADIASRTSAVVGYRLHDGYPPSHHDCDYTYGLLTQVTALFGLPPAEIRHERCQVEGADECVYLMRWRPRRGRLRPWRRTGGQVLDAAVVHQRLQELQHAVTELVGRADTDLDAVLSHVAERAAYAVNARAFVLAARLDPQSEPAVHVNGLRGEGAAEFGRRLLDGRPLRSRDHVIVAPVRSGDRDYGRLAALAPAPFLAAELELLKAYAALAAAALDGLVSRQEAEHRRRSAEILLTFAGQVAEARRPDQVVRLAARAFLTLPVADVACILLAQPDGALVVADHCGATAAEASALAGLRIGWDDSPQLRSILAAPHHAEVLTAGSGPPFVDRLLEAVDVRTVALVTLRCADHLHGLGVTGWRRASGLPYAGAQLLDRLRGAAIQTTIGLDKTELLEQVQRQAQTDPLTGLVNRRRFMEELAAGQLAVTAEGGAAGLLFLDLDRFKAVNDTLGHAAGDALLVEVAARLGACLGPADVLARLGGDEFTVLRPAVAGEGDLLDVAARILHALDEPVRLGADHLVVRPSIGAALILPGGDAGDALRAADEAMYAAKRLGGGRALLADGAGSSPEATR